MIDRRAASVMGTAELASHPPPSGQPRARRASLPDPLLGNLLCSLVGLLDDGLLDAAESLLDRINNLLG